MRTISRLWTGRIDWNLASFPRIASRRRYRHSKLRGHHLCLRSSLWQRHSTAPFFSVGETAGSRLDGGVAAWAGGTNRPGISPGALPTSPSDLGAGRSGRQVRGAIAAGKASLLIGIRDRPLDPRQSLCFATWRYLVSQLASDRRPPQSGTDHTAPRNYQHPRLALLPLR